MLFTENVGSFYIENKSADKGLSSQTLSNLRPLRSLCEYWMLLVWACENLKPANFFLD